MGSVLPEIPLARFRDQLRELSPTEVTDPVAAALYAHYTELRRWNPRLSLIGPGTAREVLSRHYGESLAALPLLRPDDRRLVDLGSGAGFPGLVLAVALPRLEVTLVEAQQKKWAFLRSASRRIRSAAAGSSGGGLSCECLNARVGRPLPEELPTEIDVVTSRAVALGPEILEALARRSQRARFLLWRGRTPGPLPPGFSVRRELKVPGSVERRILEIQRV